MPSLLHDNYERVVTKSPACAVMPAAFSRCQTSKSKRAGAWQQAHSRLSQPRRFSSAFIRRASSESDSDVNPMTGATYENPEVRQPKPSCAVNVCPTHGLLC